MNSQTVLRVGVVCDLLEEHWPSMDLVADELLCTLPEVVSPRIVPTRLRPAMPRWPAALAHATGLTVAVNANRYLDRHRRYPMWLRQHRAGYDAYHIVDHTYAHLVHELPAMRTVVTCHDVDAFRSLFDPEREPRSGIFRAMARRVLEGLRRAAIVTCDSAATRDALVMHGLRTNRLEVVPLGVHPAFTPVADPAPYDGDPLLLHVGSTIARKRIDVLLRVLARVRNRRPGARLVRVGGAFTAEQAALARALGVAQWITVMPAISQAGLADLYRQAALVLLPSETEGFGLPVIEEMACGTPVLASDLAVLHEVGGAAAAYAPVGNVEAWAAAVDALLAERDTLPEQWTRRRKAAVERAAAFTWGRFAQRMAECYTEVAGG
ncbi:MAG: glycosyltransferase family 1 protein [Gemmatimonadaceae bacterium]